MSETQLQKVLIIDDSSDYRKLIKLFINKLLPELEVIEHDPVAQGVPDENFNWSDYDVLLLDFQLSIPGITGLDLLQKYHKKPEFPATIMLTGAGTEEVAIRAMKIGIYKYQSKQSLTKDKLKQYIIHAWESKKEERKHKLELTQQNEAFSKEVFYEKLRMAAENPDINRLMMVLQPDNIIQVEKNIGVIGRDNLINFIAKKCFEVFKLGECGPNITRISDTSIAIQIDFPDSWNTLEHNIQGLCRHLSKSIYRFADETYDYSVSIGIIKLGEVIADPLQLIEIATEAARKSSWDDNNSYYIWKEEDVFVASETKSPNTDADEREEKNTAIDEETEAVLKEKEQLEKELVQAKSQLEAEVLAAKQTREKLEAELKALSAEKAKLEDDVRAKAQQANTVLEPAAPQKTDIEETPISAPVEQTTTEAETEKPVTAATSDDVSEPVPSREEIETSIKQLLSENRIIQTYQPVISMTGDEHEEDIESYQTGMISYDENSDINESLKDISSMSEELQQAINEFMLRQIFARITESGIDKTPYRFIINVTEVWFTNINLFQWLQKILTQTKKYNPGKAIIISVPLPLYKKHQKRASAVISALHKVHHFHVALSHIEKTDDTYEGCKEAFANFLFADMELLKNLSSKMAPSSETTNEEDNDKMNLLQYLKHHGIRVITDGIEDATLLTDAITAGTDYAIGAFVGEIQESLNEATSVESFELT